MSKGHSQKASGVWHTPGRRLHCYLVHKSPAQKDWPWPARWEDTPAGKEPENWHCSLTPQLTGKAGEDLCQTSHPGNGCSTAESSQLHQLVHAEAIFTEELLINVLGLLLPAQQSIMFRQSLQSGHGLDFSVDKTRLYPRYLMGWVMLEAGLWLLAAAFSWHDPVWATTAATREVTRKPIPNRVLTLNIQLDPDVHNW